MRLDEFCFTAYMEAFREKEHVAWPAPRPRDAEGFAGAGVLMPSGVNRGSAVRRQSLFVV